MTFHIKFIFSGSERKIKESRIMKKRGRIWESDERENSTAVWTNFSWIKFNFFRLCYVLRNHDSSFSPELRFTSGAIFLLIPQRRLSFNLCVRRPKWIETSIVWLYLALVISTIVSCASRDCPRTWVRHSNPWISLLCALLVEVMRTQ